jgi:hypothetical protein
LEFTIHIGNAFVIEALDVPEGLVDVSYYGRLTSKYGTGKITYRVVRGDLPLGLELNRHGEISGYPKKPAGMRCGLKDKIGQDDPIPGHLSFLLKKKHGDRPERIEVTACRSPPTYPSATVLPGHGRDQRRRRPDPCG